MVQHLRTLFAVLLAAVSLASNASAPPHADPEMLLLEPMPAFGSHVPARAKPRTGLVGRFNGRALSADTLEIVLADGRSVTAAMRRTVRDDTGVVQTWTGSFVDSPGSVLSLTRSHGAVAGFASYEGRTMELLPTRDGRHVLFELNTETLPRGDEFLTNHRNVVQSLGAGADMLDTSAATAVATTAATTTSTTATVHDVLIYYTSAAASKWGQSTLENMVRSAVQAANVAYQDSQVRVALNIVGLKPAPISEGSSMSATVNALKSNSTARATRDSLGADMVVIMAQNSDFCGYATLWYSYSGTTTNWDAYAGVYPSCLSTQALAHEVAHLQQVDHNRGNEVGLAAYAYSYGYRLCTTGGFRDIMSYPCSTTVARLNYFSNPNLTYNGYPLGISYSTDPTRAADAARSLNDTATKVANYRPTKVTTSPTPTATVPASPTTLAASSVRYNSVSLSWSDWSSNEAGFKVQRSKDGVNYTVIATLGANTVSYSDSSVAPVTTYYYRVLAYNSAGNSGFSNVLAVKTPGVKPAAPTTISATNGGNGTATITWVDKSAVETKFEIRRSQWSSLTQTWSSAIVVGSVGANVTRYVNSSGRGTFRYYVRAVNSYGASSWVGPAQVTVTGG